MAIPLLGPPPKQPCVAVVVVHGVGPTAPGDALHDLVASARADDESRPSRFSEVHRLTVTDPAPDSFVVHAHTVIDPSNPLPIRLYDVHWADISSIRSSGWSGFKATLSVVLESRTLVASMLRSTSGAPVWFGVPLITASTILQSLIIPLTLCFVAFALAVHYGGFLVPMLAASTTITPSVLTAFIPAAVMVLVSTLFAVGKLWLPASSPLRETCKYTAFVALCVGVTLSVMFLLQEIPWHLLSPDLSQLSGILNGPSAQCAPAHIFGFWLGTAWAAWGLALLGGLALALVTAFNQLAMLRPGKRAHVARAAVSVIVLQAAAWVMLLSISVIPLFGAFSVEGVLLGFEAQGLPRCNLGILTLPFLATGVAIVLGSVAVAVTWGVRRLTVLLCKAAPRLLLGWFIVLGIWFAGAIFVLLVVFGPVQVYFPSVLSKALGPFSDSSWLLETVLEQTVQHLRYITAAVTGVSIVALSALVISPVVHVAQDLINHQSVGRRQGPTPSPEGGEVARASWELIPFVQPESPRTSRPLQEDRRSDTPRRECIRARFETLVDALRSVDDGHVSWTPERWVLVGHSQGSVVIYDYLCLPRNSVAEFLRRFRPHVITLGSPLRHLYQEYVAEYQDISASLGDLLPHLGSWTNVFRIDDYIGKDIDAWDVAGRFRDVPLRRGGHTAYWSEKFIWRLIRVVAKRPAQ